MNYKYNEKTCVHLWAGSPFCEIKSKNETIYAYTDQYELALENFTKAIKNNPEFIDAYYNRGKIYEELKRFDNANLDFQKVEELNK